MAKAKRRYEVLRTGMNGRLDSIQAAVLLAKLTVFPDELVAREKIACYYDQRLGNTLTIPARVPDSTAAWAIYSVLLPEGCDRATVQDTLRADGVPTAIYYPRPLHRQPAYREHHDGAALPVSDHLADRILALPIHPDMDEAAACHMCATPLVAALSLPPNLTNNYSAHDERAVMPHLPSCRMTM